jgi:hypothetical protein
MTTPLDRLHNAVGAPAVIARRAIVFDDKREGGFDTLPLDVRALGERAARAVLGVDQPNRASVVDLQGASGIVLAIFSWMLGKLDDTDAVQAMRYARRDVAAGALLRSDPDRAVEVEGVVQRAVRELDTREVIDRLAEHDHAGRLGDYAARLAIASADVLRACIPLSHLHAAAVEIAHSAGQAAAGVVPGFDGFGLDDAGRLDRSAMATLQALVRSNPSGGANFSREA